MLLSFQYMYDFTFITKILNTLFFNLKKMLKLTKLKGKYAVFQIDSNQDIYTSIVKHYS